MKRPSVNDKRWLMRLDSQSTRGWVRSWAHVLAAVTRRGKRPSLMKSSNKISRKTCWKQAKINYNGICSQWGNLKKMENLKAKANHPVSRMHRSLKTCRTVAKEDKVHFTPRSTTFTIKYCTTATRKWPKTWISPCCWRTTLSQRRLQLSWKSSSLWNGKYLPRISNSQILPSNKQ